MRCLVLYFGLAVFLLSCAGDEGKDATSDEVDRDIPISLPFEDLTLEDLSAFETTSENWKVVGGVISDFSSRHHLSQSEGVGILANEVYEGENQNIFTKMQHGDLELHVDFMMPKESNSGIYFQGRYEVQLFDSWMKDTVNFSDLGGIYQRWNDQLSANKGFDGKAPKVNAAKAPGLWQHLHMLFRAPRFDSDGQKIRDAHFEFVDLNGHRIHEQVRLSGPTRAANFHDEQPLGPLMLQGDHGPVAFKNIRYKRYFQDTLELEDLTYNLYKGKWDYIPDFDSLQPIKSGSADFLDPKEVTDQPDHYGVIFRGKLQVKIAGTYLFETNIDDGGDLTIDSILVVANEGEPGAGIERGQVYLDVGTHDLIMTYYQEVWGASIRLDYEGPQISKRTLRSNVEIPAWVKAERAKPRVTIDPKARPELVRGFVDHGPRKTTHSISVGDPSGVHFSYNLEEGTLIKSWRGPFADVTDMWRGRGISQLTSPLNAPVIYSAGLPVARLATEKSGWPSYRPDGFRFLGYELDATGKPHFQYVLGQATIVDHIKPTSDRRLKRVLSVQNLDGTVWHRIGSADKIEKLDNGLFSIGGQYYISTNNDLQMRKVESGAELLAKLDDAEGSAKIEYEIIW